MNRSVAALAAALAALAGSAAAASPISGTQTMTGGFARAGAVNPPQTVPLGPSPTGYFADAQDLTAGNDMNASVDYETATHSLALETDYFGRVPATADASASLHLSALNTSAGLVDVYLDLSTHFLGEISTPSQTTFVELLASASLDNLQNFQFIMASNVQTDPGACNVTSAPAPYSASCSSPGNLSVYLGRLAPGETMAHDVTAGLSFFYDGDPSGDASALGSFAATYDLRGVSVPEPATWALMLGGFGLGGASLRRRRDGLRGQAHLIGGL